MSNKIALKNNDKIDIIGTTKDNHTVARISNPESPIRYDYISDSVLGKLSIMLSDNSIEEFELIIEDMKELLGRKKQLFTDVHTEHCCKNCGCKYGDEGRDCSVTDKLSKQPSKCTGNCFDL